MKIKKKHLLLTLLFVIANVLIYVSILPYAQHTANQHMNCGPAIGYLFYALSFVFILLGGYQFLKTKTVLSFLVFFTLALISSYWGYQFQNLQCLKCALGG
ncbi:hypothetical protein [Lishizhenia tianjinensis]|uniref:hypothetical protein n=1 Tax=Lishizhenia tianjinensis TaxID=477690 RepID=UPI000B7DC705|nr:hypothetical protein [Lishizhenia tianjinensis]